MPITILGRHTEYARGCTLDTTHYTRALLHDYVSIAFYHSSLGNLMVCQEWKDVIDQAKPGECRSLDADVFASVAQCSDRVRLSEHNLG